MLGSLSTAFNAASQMYKKNRPKTALEQAREMAMQSGDTAAAGAATAAMNKPKEKRPRVLGSSYGSFSTPEYQSLNWADAIKRAREQLAPMQDMARTNQGVIAQQQGNLLAQTLNARGQLTGGLMNQGSMNNAQRLMQGLGDTDRQYDAMSMDRAQGLIDADKENQYRQFQNALAEWQANRGAFEADRGYDFDREKFGYGQQRDIVADTQWGKSFNQSELQRQMQQREMLAGMLGVDPVTGKRTLQGTMSDRDYEINKGQLAISRMNAANGGGGGRSNSYNSLTKNQEFDFINESVADLGSAITSGAIKSREEAISKFAPYRDYLSKEAQQAIDSEINRLFPPKYTAEQQMGTMPNVAGGTRSNDPYWYMPGIFR